MIKYVPTRSFTQTVKVAKLASDGKIGVTLPKDLVMTAIAVKVAEAATTGTSPKATVTAGSATCEVALDDDKGTMTYKAVSSTTGLTEDTDVVVTLSGDPTDGVVEVSVLGMPVFEDLYASAGDNQAPVDPYKQPEVA